MLSASTLLVALLASAVHTAPEPQATPAPSRQEVARALQARASGDGNTPLPMTAASPAILSQSAYTFAYNQVPNQVNPYDYLRGPQTGTNICNSTTENPNGMCQTALLNSIDSFCLWGSPGTTANETIGDIEAEVVAYCTRAGLGGRIMPAGTITGLQFMRTSAYIQFVGYLNQTGLGLQESDSGGELDPHGADLVSLTPGREVHGFRDHSCLPHSSEHQLGNPLGGLVYSSEFPGANTSGNPYGQVVQWNNFVGSGVFCFKLCFPNVTTPDYCQNKYDIIGCDYNMPSNVSVGEFVSCDGDLQDEVGTYTGSNGKTTVWSQPEDLGTSTLPWTPRVPASSNCVTHASTALFPLASLGYQAGSASASAASSASSAASASRSSAASSRTDTSSHASATSTSSAAASTTTRASAAGSMQATGIFGGLLSLLAAFIV
ncbi:BQ2448_6491 [Microbotryum intermedium]|uniref:BQ2448_6491 protein n=1 Tax=Microbotryum intermedium TaxID=269621 RepID=A0A238FMN8_9BASI|nr:BQ2448_6491 [Microbotryum intermedium]